MKTYPDVEAYLQDLDTDPRLAVVSRQMAADALGLQRSTIDKRLKDKKLTGIKIGKMTCVSAWSINEELRLDSVMVAKMRQHLSRLATLGQTVEYSPFMAAFGLDSNLTAHRNQVGRLLGKLSTTTFEEHGFLLSVLVVYKGSGIPADSFFGLAGEDNLDDPDYADAASDEAYFASHSQKVFDHFKRHPQ